MIGDRIRYVVSEWRDGKAEGFPACCRARYCWDLLRGRHPAVHRGRDMGCACRGYVPCAVFHRTDECLSCPVRADLDYSHWERVERGEDV